MRDSARIDDVLAEIKKVWERYPDFRLGQLLGYSVNELLKDERGATDGELARRFLRIEEPALLAGLAKLERRLDTLSSRQED